VFRLCLQNPSDAVFEILQQTLRSRQTRVLELAAPFLNIPLDKGVPHKTVLFSCLLKILSLTSPYDTSFGFIVECISEICPKYVKYQQLYEMIVSLIEASMGTPQFPKVIKFLDVFEKIVHSSKAGINPEEWGGFLLRQVIVTYAELDGEKYTETLQIRHKCLHMLGKLPNDLGLFKLDRALILPSLSNLELGLLYIRCPFNRSDILDLMIRKEEPNKISYDELVRLTIILSVNSDEKEWEHVISFCSIFLKIGLQEETEYSMLQLVNDALVESICILGISMSQRAIFSHCVAFHSYYCDVNAERGQKFTIADRISMIGALVKALFAMDLELKDFNESKEENERQVLDPSFFQTPMLNILSLTDWLIINDPRFVFNTRNDLLDLIACIPRQSVGDHTPICKAIFFRVVNGKNMAMLPLCKPEDTNRKLDSIQENLDAYYS